jgi:alpha-beta hydrolase superfamily lysophospholipase
MDEIRTGPPSRLPVAYRHPVTGAALAAAAAWTAYSMFFVPHNLPLPPAVESPRRETVRRAGRLSYYADDAAPGADRLPPLLLIHSINAAASAYEVRPLFEWARRSRAVYAVDLPGYGFSDRSDRRYDPRLFTDAVLDMLDEIGERHDGKIDALAVSLGC